MELKWLEDFVSLANTRSFSRSAADRNITQPAFSRRIRALETWLGAELIDRSTYPTTLTAAGRTFRATAEEVLTLLGQQRDEFRLAHGRDHLALRFAALHTISLTFYPRWLARLEQALGPLSTRLVPANLHDCVEALEQGDCDFLLCFAHEAVPIMVDPAQFPSILVARDRLVPVTPAGMDPTRFPGSAATPCRLLAYSADCFLGRIVEHILTRHQGHHFQTVYENSMAEALKAMALEGHGAAWLPESSIRHELADGRLCPAGDPADRADWALPLEIRLYRSAARLRSPAAALWSQAVALGAG